MGTIRNNYYLLNDKYRVLNHILFWLAYFLFSGIVQHFGSGFGGFKYFPIIFIIDLITIYYCLFHLIPKFIVRKQNIYLFSLYLSLSILTNLLLNFLVQNFVVNDSIISFYESLESQAYSIQLSSIFIVLAIGLKIFKINLKNIQQISKLEKEKVVSELDFLKTQINPHFLFNILNNIYIQTRIDATKSSDMILKLSDLLRYQLYECSQDKVMLKSEIDYLQNYVALQKMRIAKVEVKFEQNGSFKGLMIYPFMFITFIENAFKYGISSKGVDNFIYVNVEIVEKKVIFTVKNSIIDTKSHVVKKGGIGLVNIKRRLELLYKESYTLEIDNRENYYYVELKIDLE